MSGNLNDCSVVDVKRRVAEFKQVPSEYYDWELEQRRQCVGEVAWLPLPDPPADWSAVKLTTVASPLMHSNSV